MTSLQQNTEYAAHLAKQLGQALKIEALWPQAFLNGQACRFCVVKGMDKYPSTKRIIKHVYLKRADGATRDVTIKQYEDIAQ